jgi:hypothetical protein
MSTLLPAKPFGVGQDRAIFGTGPLPMTALDQANELRGCSEAVRCANDAAELEEQTREQSRDLHLADAKFGGDVGLRALLKEAQPDEPAFGFI